MADSIDAVKKNKHVCSPSTWCLDPDMVVRFSGAKTAHSLSPSRTLTPLLARTSNYDTR